MNEYKIHFLKEQTKDFKIFAFAIVKANDIKEAIESFEKNINSFGEIIKVIKINKDI